MSARAWRWRMLCLLWSGWLRDHADARRIRQISAGSVIPDRTVIRDATDLHAVLLPQPRLRLARSA